MKQARRALLLTIVGLGACARQAQQPTASSASASDTSTSTQRDTPPANRPVDASSEEAFTSSALDLLKGSDPSGAWSRKEPLTLANARGLVVSLDRIWNGCQSHPDDCTSSTRHFVAEVVKVAASSRAKATASQFIPALRSKSYVEGMPPEGRAALLLEPFVADLVVVYVGDFGGSVRGLQASDLEASEVSREALPGVARKNIGATLSPVAELDQCNARGVKVWASGNYFESSRLLLSEPWTKLAELAHGSLLVTAPGADTLVVACDPDRAMLRELAATTEKLYRSAGRPLSRAVLKWSGGGWTESKP
jgi:uncharacterized protein YtpQ (UPF0354 family)